ncbi:MAG TPA: hypothetical protein PLD46_02820 [Hyphomicrobium sp.]|nr:hypothetical protein [Hyphomicrobium sp.]
MTMIPTFTNSAVVPAATNVIPLQARAPERLVGVGFRCWLTGFTTGEIGCWEEAWNTFSSTLGNDRAKTLLLDLSQFVRAVSATSERNILVQTPGCKGFCRDECLAISIIAACQHDAREALRASASALIGSDDIGGALSGAQTFAHGLRAANQILSADSVCPATCALKVGRSRLM